MKQKLVVRYSIFSLLAIAIVVIDQVTKAAIVKSFAAPGDTRVIVKGLLDFTYVQNKGAAFGIMQGAKIAFIVITLAVFAVTFYYFKKYKPAHPLFLTAVAFVLGGAVGNLIDRVWLSYVRDFIDVAFIDFPVFNIADSTICIGALLVVICAFFDLKTGGQRGNE